MNRFSDEKLEKLINNLDDIIISNDSVKTTSSEQNKEIIDEIKNENFNKKTQNQYEILQNDAKNSQNLENNDVVELTDTGEKKKEVKWSDEQNEVIDERDKNLLVSASAGSGKTAVMTQRIVNLVYKDRIPILNFLVVTFTHASAMEMKSRIIKKLQEIPQDDFVLEQIDNVATSDISNFHSFYSRLISTYFYEVDTDPTYHIIDDSESNFLKQKAMTKLFEKKQKENDEVFYNVLDMLQVNRSDSGFKNIILELKNYLDTHVDGEKWLYSKLDESYNLNLKDNICANYILKYVCVNAENFSKQSSEFAQKAFEFGCEKYYNYFNDIASSLSAISFSKDFMTNAKNTFEIKIPTIPTITDEKHKFLVNEAKELQASVKNYLSKAKKYFVSTDENEIKNGLVNARKLIENVYKLTKEYSEIYMSLKKDINGLDFNDLERFAYKLLQNDAIRQSLKDKYRYIFVDEYQDVNEIQEKIISMISRDNNRFMVGDLKQNIYAFRLCDPEFFIEKYKQYSGEPNSRVIKLNKNFRSNKYILKFVDKIFSGKMTEKFGGIDYATESIFTAGDSNPDNDKSVYLCYIDTDSEKKKNKEEISNEVYSVKKHNIQTEDLSSKAIVAEAKVVANKIAEIRCECEKNNTEFNYSDFAVLVSARNKEISTFADELKNYSIPVSSDGKINLLEKTYIQEIINFARFVTNSYDDFVLFKVLKSKLFNFSDSEIVKLRKINIRSKFFETIEFLDELEDENLKEKLKKFIQAKVKYKKLAQVMKIKDFVKLVVDEFKLENINYMTDDGEIAIEHINKFISVLPDVSVNEFLIGYSSFAIIIENECGGNNVSIMTIHKSKGIEFKYVFIIDLFREINYKDSVTGKFTFNKDYGVSAYSYDTNSRVISSTIVRETIGIFERKKIAEEQQRLLYVALTRAKNKLFVICSAEGKKLTNKFPPIPAKYSEWFYDVILEQLKLEKENQNSKVETEKESDDNYIIFEHYFIDDFIQDTKKNKKQLLFTEIKVERPQEFAYKYSKSVSAQLKSSISKILKQREMALADANQVLQENVESDYENEIDDVFEKFDSINDDSKFDDKQINNSNSENENLQELSPKDSSENVNFSSEENRNYFAERGTAYHKVLQNIDFSNLENLDYQCEKIKEKFAKNDNDDTIKYVNFNKIKRLLSNDIFKTLKNYNVLKEREFFAKVPLAVVQDFDFSTNLCSDFDSYDTEDEIIMQGAIDLLAVGDNDLIVIDYKTGKFSEEKMEKYKFQLNFYASICKRYFKEKTIKKYICFIDEEKIVEF